MKIYKFNILFEGDDIEDIQQRFVCAFDEEEAYRKIEKYRNNLKKQGFANFNYFYKGIEIDHIIT